MNNYSEHSNMQNPNTQNMNTPENTEQPGGLSTASRICGVLSMTLGMFSVTACCLGYLSIPIGALGILFAVLSRRIGKQMPIACKTGLMLSITGLLIGIIMMIFHVYTTITDPSFWEYTQEMIEMYEEMYGIEMY